MLARNMPTLGAVEDSGKVKVSNTMKTSFYPIISTGLLMSLASFAAACTSGEVGASSDSHEAAGVSSGAGSEGVLRDGELDQKTGILRAGQALHADNRDTIGLELETKDTIRKFGFIGGTGQECDLVAYGKTMFDRNGPHDERTLRLISKGDLVARSNIVRQLEALPNRVFRRVQKEAHGAVTEAEGLADHPDVPTTLGDLVKANRKKTERLVPTEDEINRAWNGKKCQLVMQNDNNLVLYGTTDEHGDGQDALWASDKDQILPEVTLPGPRGNTQDGPWEVSCVQCGGALACNSTGEMTGTTSVALKGIDSAYLGNGSAGYWKPFNPSSWEAQTEVRFVNGALCSNSMDSMRKVIVLNAVSGIGLFTSKGRPGSHLKLFRNLSIGIWAGDSTPDQDGLASYDGRGTSWALSSRQEDSPPYP